MLVIPNRHTCVEVGCLSCVHGRYNQGPVIPVNTGYLRLSRKTVKTTNGRAVMKLVGARVPVRWQWCMVHGDVYCTQENRRNRHSGRSQ